MPQDADTQRAIDGRFVEEDIHARGAMGTIIRGVDLWTGDRVAIKRMIAPTLDVDRFRREAEVLGRLTHDGIVKWIASGEDGLGPWIVMEWLDGRDLSAVLPRSGPFEMSLAVELGAQLAEAVAAAHARGVVHRDIKPGNIVVLNNAVPRLKLVDFGVAKDLDATALLTATGALVGTPLYMAPEQLRGEPVGPLADVYAVAAVVYEMIAGHAPFVAETPFAAIARALVDEAPRLEACRSDVPHRVADAVHGGLSRAVADRCDATFLAAALRSVAAEMQQGPTLYQERVDRRTALLAERRRTAAMVVRGVDDKATVDDALQAQASARDALPDGTVIALFADTTSPDAPVLRAVSVGLALTKLVPRAVVLIASGMLDTREDSKTGEGFRRVGLLNPGTPGVHVDRVTAGIVARRYELVWSDEYATVLSEVSTEQESLVLGKTTLTVGRQAELAQLSAMIEAVTEDGAPRIAIVEGPAGMGKSRLRREITRRSQTDQGALCITATFEPDSIRSAWGGFARALRTLGGIRGGQAISAQRALLKVLAQQASLSERELAFLGEVARVAADVDPDVLRAARASPELMKEGVADAMGAVVRGVGGDGAVLLVLEDAHWADQASLELVSLLTGRPDLPLAVMAFARPTLLATYPNLWSMRAPLRLSLSPLSPRAASKLVRSVLPSSASTETVDEIVKLGAGNPLVLEELVRVAAESGEIATTETARAVFEARLGMLGGEERLTARAAAVIGEVFWDAALRELLGGSDVDVGAALTALERKEIIARHRGSRFVGQTEYSFRHALVRDAALAMVPADAAVMLHARAAQWLSSVGEPDVAVIAGHAEAGGLREMAAECYEEAGRAALAAQELQMALALLDKASALMPRSRFESRWRLDLALETLCRELALDRKRLRHLAALRREARLRPDPSRTAVALTREARFRYDRSEHASGTRRGMEAVRVAQGLGEPALFAEAALWVTSNARESSATGAEHAVLDEVLSTQDVPDHLRALLHRARGVLRRRQGHLAAAVTDYERALAICDEAGSRIAVAEALCALGYATIIRGELSRAKTLFNRALGLRKTMGSRRDVAKMLANEGNIWTAVGAWPEASACLDRALDDHRDGVDMATFADTLSLRARCALEQGDEQLAEQLLREAQNRAHETDVSYDLAHAALIMGWLRSRQCIWESALGSFEECRSYAEKAGDAAFLAAGFSGCAWALAKLDRGSEARAAAAEALKRLAAMDASEWAGETFYGVVRTQLRADPLTVEATLVRARRWADDFEERIGADDLRARFRERSDVRLMRGGTEAIAAEG